MEQKKEYQIPEMKVVELKHQNNLLSASNGADPNPYGNGPLN
jgi:hypothetical protein